jgi:hypothetical protein
MHTLPRLAASAFLLYLAYSAACVLLASGRL